MRGRILPATLASVHLRGHAVSGRVYEGESLIGGSRERLERIELVPAAPAAYPPALGAIREADLVLLGPGSLYTSILPNLLIPELTAALRATAAPVVLVMNLMTQPGETDGLSALDHLAAIEAHLGRGLLDAALVHAGELAAERLLPYRAEGAAPLAADAGEFRAHGVRAGRRRSGVARGARAPRSGSAGSGHRRPAAGRARRALSRAAGRRIRYTSGSEARPAARLAAR